MKEPAISCQNITVQYTSPLSGQATLKETFVNFLHKKPAKPKFFRAVNDVSFDLMPGECVAIVGPNGCGKSTLLKVIAGVIDPYRGSVKAEGIIAPLIELGAGFDPELSGIENIFMSCSLMGVPKLQIEKRLDEIVTFAEIGDFIFAPVKTYSSGMYMRLGFACSTIINPDILLIDEILAVGDARFQTKCMQRLKEIQEQGKTIVMVSHDFETIRSMCKRAILMWEGVKVYDGDVPIAFEIYGALQDRKHLTSSIEDVVSETIRRSGLHDSAMAGKRKAEAYIAAVRSSLEGDEHGKNLVIEADIVSNKDHDEPLVIGFQIKNHQSPRLFGYNSRNTQLEENIGGAKLKRRGTHTVRWVFRGDMLASGIYKVDACLSDYDITTIFDLWDTASEFNVTNQIDAQNRDGNLIELRAVDFTVSLQAEAQVPAPS